VAEQQLVFRFENLSDREAADAAQELQHALTEAAPGIKVALQRDRTEAQDLGATLVLVLGTEAVIALAKGIANYLGKRGVRPGTLIAEWEGADGKQRVFFEGSSVDAAKVAEVLRPVVNRS